MSQHPRPESRLSEIESKMAIQDARIRELSDDTAESLRDLRQTIQTNFTEVKQDLKQLSQNKTDWQEVDTGLKLVATKEDLKALATKEDIKDMATKGDVSRLEAAMATKEDFAAMETHIIETVRQFLQQKLGD